MKGTRTRSLLCAAALGAAIFPAQSPAQMPLIPAMTISSQPVYFERSYVGRVTPVDQVNIASKVPGEISTVKFTEGSFVEAGEVLLLLDPEPYQLALESAQAALLGTLAQHDNAQITLARSEELIKTNAISQQKLLDDKADARITEASVAKAEAAVRQAELNLRYTQIIAPVSGRIGERKVSVGDLVLAGTSEITEITVMDPVNVALNVTERDLLDGVIQSSELELTLANGEVYPLTGEVDFIDNAVSANSGTIMARASFPNPENRLVPGLFANIRAVDSRSSEQIVVPQQAVMENQGGRYVYIVDENQQVAVRTVTTGVRIGSDWVIDGGLKDGDVVLTRNLQLLRPGQDITPEIAGDV